MCILGNNPFKSALQAQERAVVLGREVVAKELKSNGDIQNCHVLYISQSESNRIGQLLDNPMINSQHILTIADMEGFSQKGGMVNLFVESSKIRFEINVEAVERAGLKISSQLLKLAKIVKH
ncbi:MAG: YfiR family protein [Candidatus Magnetoovum sp. WYHC-5]|nr:YfiR family protein [Candidatus Magnetoovum sp. WYHC-5]